MNRKHRRHARRNPSLLGFQLPPVQEVAAIAGGFIATPMLANYIYNNYVAGTSMGGSKWTYLGVEAVSVIAPAMIVKRFGNARIGNLLMLGGAARFAIDAITVLMPSLLPSVAMPTGLSGGQPFLGYYETMPQTRRLSGMGMRGMGKYFQRGVPESNTMIQNIPDRLDPSYRF